MDTVQRESVVGCCHAPGLRKITPKMLGTISVAERHKFASGILPGQILAAFKAAAPYLGLRPSVVHAIDWLFRFTDAVDWQPSFRPIVWPSAAMQQLELGVGPSQVKNINRYLVELGLVVMKDSPNGKRYGRRDPKGRIIEAYGFDLSPLACRYAEFQAIAKAGREERARVQGLKRRATIARNGIRQLLKTAVDHGISCEEWETLCAVSVTASRGIAGKDGTVEMEMAVVKLERTHRDILLCLESALDARNAPQPNVISETVDSAPMGPENWPHITTTNQLANLKDTVNALGENRSLRPPPEDSHKIENSGPADNDRATIAQRRLSKNRTVSSSLLKITPVELVKLAPRLKSYLSNKAPDWPEIVDAADWLRDEMGISKFVWGDACLAMGREQAAIAVAIVSTKSPTHFRSSAGGYFYGMVSKAKVGELHLARTIWGMRSSGEGLQK